MGMKTTTQIEAGKTYLSGNSLSPKSDTVLAIVGWEGVPERARKQVRTIEYWKNDETFAARQYVRYTVQGRRGVEYSPLSVFEGTRYVTHSDMVAAYQR